jgi:hypothetical protein
MNVREHAPLAQALQDACGGLDACLKLLEPTPFRTSRSRLYATRDAGSGRTMSIGAVAHLEGVQNWRLYSFRLARRHLPVPTAVSASAEAADAFERMARVHSLVRIADLNGWSEFSRRDVEQALHQVEISIAGIRSVMGHGLAQTVAA